MTSSEQFWSVLAQSARDPTPQPAPAVLRVSANASAVEVAALVAVLSALQTPATPIQGIASGWPARNRSRSFWPAKPGGWRASLQDR